MGCTNSKEYDKPDYNVNQRDVDAKEMGLDDIKPYKNLNARFVFLSRKTGWEVFEVRLLYAAYLEYAQPKTDPPDLFKLRIADKKAFRPLFERCCWTLFETWSDPCEKRDNPALPDPRVPAPSEEVFDGMADAAFVHFDRKHRGVDFVDFIVALHLLCRSDEREQTDFLHSIYSLNDMYLKSGDIEYFLKTIRRPQQRSNFPETSASNADGGNVEGSRMSGDELEEAEHEAMLLVKQLQQRQDAGGETAITRVLDDLDLLMGDLQTSQRGDATRRARQQLLEQCLRANRLLFGSQTEPTPSSTAMPLEAGEPRELDSIWAYRCVCLRELCAAEGGRLSSDLFATWASHHLDLRKKHLFAGFEMFPGAEEEAALYNDWQEIGLERAGDPWYVVDHKWWDNWCAYIGVDTETNRHSEQTRPTQIHNEGILDRALSRDGINVLREKLQEGVHFQLVSKEVWGQLETWYGCDKVIQRSIVERGVQRTMLSVDLYPLFVRVTRARQKGRRPAVRSFPTQATPKELHARIAEEEDVAVEEMRLWARNNGEQARLLYPVEAHDNETLNSIEWLSSGVEVVIDVKRAGEWQVEDPMKRWKPWQKMVESGAWEIGQRVDARDKGNHHWYPGKVIDRKAVEGEVVEVLVKYDGYGDKFNEWIAATATCPGCYVNGKCNNLTHCIAPVDSLNSASQKRSGAARTRADSGHDVAGLVGLSNLGNTCFMNSTLQCLSNTPLFRDKFLSDQYKKDINRSNVLGTGGRLVSSFASLLNAMWDGKRRVFAPKHFKRTIGDFAPNFEGYQQQDSQELLQYLLDGIHEDLNLVKKKRPTEKVEYDAGQKEDSEIAKECWNRYLIRNKSIVVDLFMDMIKSHVKCPQCKRSSITFEPYMYLQLPIPGFDTRTFDLKLFRLSHHEDPSRSNLPYNYRLSLPTYSTFRDLCRELEHASGIPADRMAVADIWNNKIYKLQRSRGSISSVRKDDITHVYECEVFQSAQSRRDIPRNGYIYHLERRPGRAGSTKYWPNFGDPFFLRYWKNSTCEQIHEKIFNSLLRWLPQVLRDYNLEQLPYKVWLSDNKGTSLTEMPVCDKTIKADPAIQIVFLIEWRPEVLPHVQSQMERVRDDPNGSMARTRARRGAITLLDCLDEYSKEERLDSENMWYCNKCKDHFQATKKIDIWNYPEYLVLHLKRFRQSGRGRRTKISAIVQFPLTGLNLAEHSLQYRTKGGVKPIYDLIAVSNHSGGLGGGHYTAYARNSENDQWYYFNDRSVTPVGNTADIVSQRAYVLFYQKRR